MCLRTAGNETDADGVDEREGRHGDGESRNEKGREKKEGGNFSL